MNRVSRCVRSTVLGVGAAAMLLLAGLSPASAHVNLNADTTASGSTGLLRFSFTHGCDGSATTGIAIAIPDEVTSVNPAMHPGWTIETVTDDVATPAADGHGASAPISEVVFTAKEPVPDGFYDELVLRVALPEDAAGETLYFPVIQTCEEGETAWIEIPAEGEDGGDLETPAPGVTLTEAEVDGSGH